MATHLLGAMGSIINGVHKFIFSKDNVHLYLEIGSDDSRANLM